MIDMRTFLPHVMLRDARLQRALREYPLYDPPHKVEERLLSRERAAENFAYFMRVREERLLSFRDWLRRWFGVAIAPHQEGVEALSAWGNKYAGLLLLPEPANEATDTYFTYDPPWVGANAGRNVVFDVGIAFGESLIAKCPQLRWDVDPISAVLPRTAKRHKRTPGTSFQRPTLTGSKDPTWSISPLHQAYMFAWQMSIYTTTMAGLQKYYACNIWDRSNIRDQLINTFAAQTKYLSEGNDDFRAGMSEVDYINFIDHGGDGDE